MNNKICAGLALLLMSTPFATNAQTTVFDTINNYSQININAAAIGYFGGPSGPNATYVAGEQFTSTADGFIGSVAMTLIDPTVPGSYGPSGIAINFGLYSDTGGRVGNLLENLAVTMNGGIGVLATGSYQSGTLLNSGQSYWLVSEGTTPGQWASTNAPDAPIVENEYANLQQPSGLSGGLYPGGSYSSMLLPLGMTVKVSAPVAAPEINPASAASGLTLLLGGMAVLLGRRRLVP
jgi:hypothetical protein